MDIASETHWSTLKNNEQAEALREYKRKFANDEEDSKNYLESFLRTTRFTSESPPA